MLAKIRATRRRLTGAHIGPRTFLFGAIVPATDGGASTINQSPSLPPVSLQPRSKNHSLVCLHSAPRFPNSARSLRERTVRDAEMSNLIFGQRGRALVCLDFPSSLKIEIRRCNTVRFAVKGEYQVMFTRLFPTESCSPCEPHIQDMTDIANKRRSCRDFHECPNIWDHLAIAAV